MASVELNPDDYPVGTTWALQAIVETTNVANACQVRLYNHTLGATEKDLVDGTSLDPEYKSEAITPASGSNTYELLLKMGAGASPDKVIVSHVRIKGVWV